MKKALIIVFTLVLTVTNAQNDKKFLLRTSFGYNYSHMDRMDAGAGYLSNNIFGKINKEFTVVINGSRRLKNNFYYGLGFSYLAGKQEINPDGDIPKPGTSTGYVTYFTSYSNSVTLNKIYSPIVFFQYYYDISERFSINLDAWSRYDFTSETFEANFFSMQIQDSIFIAEDNLYQENKKQFIAFGISPSIRVSIIKNMGLELIIGSLEFKQKLKDSRAPDDNDRYTSEFTVGFKPENWLIGIFVKI